VCHVFGTGTTRTPVRKPQDIGSLNERTTGLAILLGRSFAVTLQTSGMIRNRGVRKVVVFVTLSAFSTACYVQRPLVTAVPSTLSRIVALVTDTGSVVMSNAIGPAAVEIEGIVVEANAESWTLQMLRVEQRGGFSTRWNREVVTFPRFALTSAGTRVLDKRRSWLFAAAVVAAILGSMLFYGDLVGGGGPDPDPPPPV
jgi:hypothetical protein